MAAEHFPKGALVNVFLPPSLRRNLPFFVARQVVRDNPGFVIEYQDDHALVALHCGPFLRVPDYCVTKAVG